MKKPHQGRSWVEAIQGIGWPARSLVWTGGLVVWLALSGLGGAEEIVLTVREGTNFAAARSPVDGAIVIDLQGTLWRLGSLGGPAVALTDGLGDDRMPDFARDGSRVYFQSYRNGSWDIWSIAADGSDLVAHTRSTSDDREPVISPDGTRIAFSSDRSGNYDIWILNIGSGAALALRQLTTDAANDSMPTWSPSGDTIAFVSERGTAAGGGLYRISLEEGASAEILRTFSDRVAAPSWSPDGDWIAVRVLDRGTGVALDATRASVSARLGLVPVDGGEMLDLTAHEDVFPFRAQWDGDALLYSANGGLWKWASYPEGAPERVAFEVPLTLERPAYQRKPVAFSKTGESGDPRPVRGIVRPVLAPDGSTIVYSALGDLWAVSASGGKPLTLTRDEFLDTDPAWSPDGRAIVFASDRGGTMDLWIRDLQAPPKLGMTRLTESLGAELSPSWSPDGLSVAFIDERSRLNVMPAKGGEPRVLTTPRRGVSMPSWSADSQRIALAVHEPMSTRFREGHNRILVVDVESGDTRLLDEPARSFGTRDGDGPVWSPDGARMAFAMDGGLWVLPVAPDGSPSGALRRLVDESVDFVSWSQDSKQLVYVTPSGLRRIDVESRRVETVQLEHDYLRLPATGRLLLRNVRLIDGTGAAPRDNMDLVIEGNRITDVSPAADDEPEDTRIVDLSGKVVIPGLIEMHAHLTLPAWGSRHGRVWLAYGVTSLRSPSEATYRVREERESIESGRRIGPRIFATGATMDGDRIYYSSSLALEDEEELEQELARAFALEYDLIKTYVRLPDALQKSVVEKAHAKGVFVSSHEVYPAVGFGIDGLEHLRGTSRRGYSPKLTDTRHSYDDVVQIIGKSGVYFTPTLLITGGWSLAMAREPRLLDDRRYRLLFPSWVQKARDSAQQSDDVESAEEAVAPLFETISAISKLGGNVLAGTDSPIVPYGLGLLLEIEQLSEAGLGPMGALRAATQLAAQALGADGDLGTLEEGKLADLVILDADPTEDIKNLRQTAYVVLNGRLVSIEQLLKF